MTFLLRICLLLALTAAGVIAAVQHGLLFQALSTLNNSAALAGIDDLKRLKSE